MNVGGAKDKCGGGGVVVAACFLRGINGATWSG